ncbi:MAG TPA: metallophosphoesterase [Longimicrobiales bacterium]|nr:metallophosphoesterase [Longimicrobiales bacterium]
MMAIRSTRTGGILVLLGAAMACSCARTAIPVAGPQNDGRAAADTGVFRVAVISDLNSAYGSTTYGPEVGRAVALLREEWRPHVVLAAGDLIAGQRPSLTDDNVRAMWTAFDSVVAAPLREAGIPFGFTLGNHDASPYPDHRRDRSFAIEHWRRIGTDAGLRYIDDLHFPLYYSFRAGPVFVAVWDAAWEGTASDTAVIHWLRQQLADERARGAAFRIVLGHLPLFSVAEGRDRPGEVLADTEKLLALLRELDVDMYISGHHHAYYPARHGGLELLHAGAVGDGSRPLLGRSEPSPRTVTLLDFHGAGGGFTLTTFALDGESPLRHVSTESLPPSLTGIRGTIHRRDLDAAPAGPVRDRPAPLH